MWHIQNMAFGLLVWPLLVTSVTSLSTDFRSERPPVMEVHVKPTHLPKEQLFLHRPGKGAKVRRVSDFARLLRGPSKGSVKLPTKRSQAPVLRSHGLLKPFGTANQPQQGPVQETVNNLQPSGLHPETTQRDDFLQVPYIGSYGFLRDHSAAAAHPEGSFISYLPTLRGAMPGQPTLSSSMQRQTDSEQVHANSMEVDINAGKILAPTIFVVVILALILVFTFCLPDDIAAVGDEAVIGNSKLCYPKSVDDAPIAHTANTKEKLLEFANSAGTWAKTYRRADKGSKEALELLFRCNIIPVHEFAESFVSQEHIDECVWISTQMLREKSLDEWVKAWPQAMKTFEESVTACFAARTDVISNLYGEGQSPPNSPQTPRSDRGFMDCRPGMPTPSSSQPRDNRSNASTSKTPTLMEEHTSSSRVRNALTRAGSLRAVPAPPTSTLSADSQDVSTSQRVSVRPPLSTISSTPSQTDSRTSVVSRCREIMSSIPVRAKVSAPETPVECDAEEAENASPASTSPSMHFRDMPAPVIPASQQDVVPASVASLGVLDSYPPSERGDGRGSELPPSPDIPEKVESSCSIGLSGTTPAPRERVPGGFSGLLGSMPRSSDLLAGTTPQSREVVPNFGSLPQDTIAKFGTMTSKSPTSSFGGLAGTTPQPKELAPKASPLNPACSPISEARSLSPREAGARGWARDDTPLFGRPASVTAASLALASSSGDRLPLASSSEDPFAGLKD